MSDRSRQFWTITGAIVVAALALGVIILLGVGAWSSWNRVTAVKQIYAVADASGHLFTALHNLRVDMVKIDGIYVKNLSQSPDNQLFVRTLVDLAKKHNVSAVYIYTLK